MNTNSLTITGASSGATQTTNGTGGLTDEYIEGFAFPQQSEYEYAVVIEGGEIYNAGRTLEDIYAYLQFKCRDGETDVFYKSVSGAIETVQGQFYIKAYTSYSTTKTAPFGTLAGGVFFSAQGVWIEGMDSGDDNSVALTDDNGDLQEPTEDQLQGLRVPDLPGVRNAGSGQTESPDRLSARHRTGQDGAGGRLCAPDAAGAHRPGGRQGL